MQNNIFNTYQYDDQIKILTYAKGTACIFIKNITKNWQFVPNKASISLSLNVIAQCKYWM